MRTDRLRRLPIFYGWVLVATAFVTMGIVVNARTAFSLFFPSILDEFGWSRALTAATFTTGLLASNAFTPFLGVLMDRVGPRVVFPVGLCLQIHQTKYLLELGFSAELAGYALGLVGLPGIGGQIVWGHVSDRIGREWAWTASGLGFALCYLALLALPAHPTRWLVYVMVAAQGLLGYGLASVFGAIPMELFQGARYGSIFAVLNLASNAGAGTGPLVAGLVHDRTGSYAPAFWIAIAFSAVSVTAMWLAAPARCGSSPAACHDEGERTMTDALALLGETRRELARFPALLDAMVADLAPDQWRARPAPDEWAAVEIVCHLRDEEAEDFGARVRVLLEEGTRFAPVDPEGWAMARRYHEADPADALAAFRRRRAESLAMLGAASPARLAASGESPSGLRLSGLDLLAAWVAHDGLHLRQLAGTLTREWADRWAPLRAEYAGPLPYARPGERGA